MFKLVQQINYKYWTSYIAKHNNINYILNKLFKKYEKRQSFVRYLRRVNKPLFLIRFIKKQLIYAEKWSDVSRQENKYHLFFNKKYNNRQIGRYTSNNKNNIAKDKQYYYRSNRRDIKYDGNKNIRENNNSYSHFHYNKAIKIRA